MSGAAPAEDALKPTLSLVELSFSGYDPGGMLVGSTIMETLVVEQSSCHQMCLGACE